MLLRRLGSIALMLAGVAFCFVGMDASAWATTCTEFGPLFPGVCAPAHQAAPGTYDPNLDLGCTPSYYFWCVPTNGSSCNSIEGYGYAIPGDCSWDLSEAELFGCVGDFAATYVVLRYHRSECQYYYGDCQCMWIIGELPNQYSEVCDCRSVVDE